MRSIATAPDPDLAGCAAEPIRVPGAIQPHGWLVAAHAASGRLAAYSANWTGLADATGPALAHTLEKVVAAVREGIAQDIDALPTPAGTIEIGGCTLDATAHTTGGLLIVELEAAVEQAGTQAPIYQLARHCLPQLQSASSVPELARVAVDEVKRLTGFGRCLVYRFDDEGHGEVLDERCDPGYASYAGHRFPASDIPPQARQLYCANHIRLIADARYTPVPLVVVDPALRPDAIDLSYAALRSVSPVHLEYMRNMGTAASMSVSLVVRGRLWGLISCHDREPRRVDFQTRAACEHLGRLLSLQIVAKEDNADVARRLELRQLTLEIVSHLADSDASLQKIVAAPQPLLALGNADGAAVVLDDTCWTTGLAPPPDRIVALAKWIARRGDDVFQTDDLGTAWPEARDHLDTAAGVLAISTSQVHRHYVLWFRAERVQTIAWAGDRSKDIDADGRIHPRRSFATWREEVHGRSLPWEPAEVAAVQELRQALLAIVLRRAQERAEVTNELMRVNQELEAFSYTVSHDLRAPMRHIAGYVDLVLDSERPNISERSRRWLGQVKEASAYAGQLVDALLDFSRMGRSALSPSTVHSETLVDDLVRELTVQEPERAIEWVVERPLPVLRGDPFLLKVALRNLLANAVKYTRGRTPAVIRVRGLRTPEGSGLEVADNGVGFQMKYADKLFGVFQRLHRHEEFEGTGIGLANVRRIVERHGGRVSAHGEPDVGATFGFTLPDAPVPAPA